ncbi:MAG: BTAD domain-containing putative transcriptional regulator, partial [Anaerolineales bacterium]
MPRSRPGRYARVIEIETLGQLKITVNGKPADGLRSHKARALLAYLAVEGGEHPRAALAALLWPESDQQHAATSLRVALTALNRACAGYLRCDREFIAIDCSQPVRLDLQELHEAAGRGEDEHALQLYGGPFLAGFDLPDCADFETWRTWQQESVLQVVTGCYHRAIERALAPDGGGEAPELALRLLKLDPLDEAAHRAIMLVHARRGNQAAAIEQYERCAEAVRSELGSEPSSQTRRLHERIRRGDPIQPDLPAFRPLAPPRKLPLVGRQMELEDLLERIQSGAQLVTLVGPGGIGKSRLAIEALRRASGAFPDGVFYCPLASVSSPDFLLPAIAQTLDFRFDSLATLLDPRSQLLDFLAARRILLL